MPNVATTALSQEHQDFYAWFKSLWAAPSGKRVAERFRPDAEIHFTGQAPMSGSDYIMYMDGMLATFPGMTVTPLDCADHGDMLYIAGKHRA